MKKPHSDQELILNLSNGDKNALFALYDNYSGALYGVILRICRNEMLAQDVLQETFVKIMKNSSSYNPEKGKFYTRSYRIARNTALNALRKTDNLIQNEDLSVHTNKTTAEPEPDYMQLNGSINTLEPHHQTAIDLVYFKGYTHQEAHEVMGVPLGTFKSYIKQALKQLRKTYTKELIWVYFIFEMIA